ncbi:choice-of-anchor A family protein [Iningainema tapete]|uniref:Choice-of-anchor A family protein n=1 Tax=Iningainema tapete BLCC-T55 TaxID=2748662 RepID=A0A8J6XKN5_9CYAN|nr:choice-of-anchor A family protein [Iningainema tapete]MBD2777969.1 choice-of-anchor A family protein [Iningainema tapete BLCC-T55]
MLVNKMLRYTQVAVPLVASCVLGFCQNANASTLGAASDFNAFVLGNMNQTSDTEGRLAVGGNATLTNYGVGDRLSDSNGTRDDLIVGGILTYNGGQVFNGNVVYGTGTAPKVSTPNGTIKQGKPIDFAAAGQELKALSAYLATLTPNNTTTVHNWGGVELKGTKSDLNIFNIGASVFAPGNNVNNFSIDGSMSSTILVNVAGKDISMKNFGFSNNLQAGLRQKVLFNFYEATNIDLQNIGFQGSILAPLANLKTTYGDVNGNVIVASSQGSGEYHNYLFKGTLPKPTNINPPKKKVPEPSSLVGLGTLAAGIVVSRRKLMR